MKLSTREHLAAFPGFPSEGVTLRFDGLCCAVRSDGAQRACADNIIRVSVTRKGIVTAGSSISCGNGQTKRDSLTNGFGGVVLKANAASSAKFEGWPVKGMPQGATCWVPV